MRGKIILIKWFEELDNQHWDKQLEKDITDGKFEDLALICDR
jgi:hypothetical protein